MSTEIASGQCSDKEWRFWHSQGLQYADWVGKTGEQMNDKNCWLSLIHTWLPGSGPELAPSSLVILASVIGTSCTCWKERVEGWLATRLRCSKVVQIFEGVCSSREKLWDGLFTGQGQHKVLLLTNFYSNCNRELKCCNISHGIPREYFVTIFQKSTLMTCHVSSDEQCSKLPDWSKSPHVTIPNL